MNLSKKSMERLKKYPVLKAAVEDFISTNGTHKVPGRLCDLTVYIRMLDVFEPEFFGWSNYYFEEFCSWGHNSRYANVLEPLLCWNLNRHVCRILDYLDTGVQEPDLSN